MVSVDGRGAPRYRHGSFEAAFREALRIRADGNQGRGVRVLQELVFIPGTYNKALPLDFRTLQFYTDVKVSVGFAFDMIYGSGTR